MGRSSNSFTSYVGHAEETIDEINDKLNGSHMLFIAAGMGGGTGTGAAPVIAQLARENGILTVTVEENPIINGGIYLT